MNKYSYLFHDADEVFSVETSPGTLLLSIVNRKNGKIAGGVTIRAVENDGVTQRVISWIFLLNHSTEPDADVIRLLFIEDVYKAVRERVQFELITRAQHTSALAKISSHEVDMLANEDGYLLHVIFHVSAAIVTQDTLLKRWKHMFDDITPAYISKLHPEIWDGLGDIYVTHFIRRIWQENHNITIDDLFVLNKYPHIKQQLKKIIENSRLEIDSAHQAYVSLWTDVADTLELISIEEDNALRLNVVAALCLAPHSIYLATHLMSQILSRLKFEYRSNPNDVLWRPVVHRFQSVDHVLPPDPAIKSLVVDCESFVCAMTLAMTTTEWPACEVALEDFPGYRHWANCEIPLTPWRSIEIKEISDQAKHYMHLYQWISWEEFHWILFFGNVKKFWGGSEGKSSVYLSTEIKRDRTRWTATSLALNLIQSKERAYTFPTNGIITRLEFGGIPEVLGFTTLMMAETAPGQLIFVAKDKDHRAAIGRWDVYQPTKLFGFRTPYTNIAEDDELLLAACICTVFYDLVTTRQDSIAVKTVSPNGESWLNKIGNGVPQEGKETPIYSVRDLRACLDQVTYKPVIVNEGRDRQQSIRHGVVGHRRWVGSGFTVSPERNKMAEAHHIYLPPGYTFVEPHHRGADSDGEKPVQRLTKVIGLHRLMMLEIEQPES